MPNRLAEETSPYLLQHKENPVDWYPWSAEALERARAEQKPILASIGYSACHWCHVMAHESFEDPAIAEQMNESFINIKIDREERPEIDAIYMTAVQAMSGHGGWPLNVFLTPDGVPFFGGTYWPPHDARGMPGFPRVLEAIASAWANDRDNLLANATKLHDYLRQSSAATPAAGTLSEALTDTALLNLESLFDAEHGGFGGAPKFPQGSVLEFLLHHHHRTGSDSALRMLTVTLDRMAAGGIYDHLGGGFARYSVDAIWLVPHFEKMLYDNAQLMSIYLDAWRITGTQRYREVVEEIATWLLREMRSPDGGFYSALDADSEGEEGKFYVWSAPEIDALLDPDAADLVRLHYGVTETGNFEGHSILFENRTLEDIANATNRPFAEIRATIDAAKRTLLEARAQRIRPGTDDKVVVSWNGMMIAALAEAGMALDRSDLVEAARTAAGMIIESGKDSEGHLCRTLKEGQARGTGVLEDYAALAGGLVSLYQTTAELRWLDEANALVDVVRSTFPHESGVGFYDTSDFHDDLVVRPRDLQDGAIASGNSLAADMLLTMGAYRGATAFEDDVRRMLAALARPMAEHPTAFGQWLSVLERLLAGTRELVLAGPANDQRDAMRGVFAQRYEPFAVLGYAADSPAFPMLADRPLPEGADATAAAAAYLCQNFTCLAPVTTPDDLTRLLDQRNAFGDDYV
ncbi:MAG: Uncharacterized protein YyaL [uncultured Thermomicrobiales bacterium]|uniref:Uncharacterized protein YyaL n=1 Tax=uncultured Thermomicrobiales bacterium TaxID=1645740 RepID=A0A6J4UCE7_9BACT|nr:MAG: Uncharacterized protein YyaL [uncultured Thermomicrobiales bacterium]